MSLSPEIEMLRRIPEKLGRAQTFETATPEARAWAMERMKGHTGLPIPLDSDLEGERLFPECRCIVAMLLHAKAGHDVTDPGTDPAPRTPEQEQASAEFWAFLRIHDVNEDGTFTLVFPDLTPESPLYMSPEAIERVKARLRTRNGKVQDRYQEMRAIQPVLGALLENEPEPDETLKSWVQSTSADIERQGITEDTLRAACRSGLKLFPGERSLMDRLRAELLRRAVNRNSQQQPTSRGPTEAPDDPSRTANRSTD